MHATMLKASTQVVTTRPVICATPRVPCARLARLVQVKAENNQSSVDTLTGVVFEPFVAAQAELAVVEKTQEAKQSLGRVNFHSELEAAINEQINVEYNVSYIYHAAYAYFNRDNVALPGLAGYFKAESVEERGHAEMLMDYQNTRGGRVKFQSILMPEMEFEHPEKGEALYAMELALSLEKLNFQKLRDLAALAEKHEDSSMSDFVDDMIADQVKAVKDVSEYVSQLRRVGKGLGVYQFDRELAGTA